MSAPDPGSGGKVHPLKDNQLKAVDPQETVWLSASAGTGKTQVLSARVLRLLLRDRISPSQILCLTFTKAGAAEMATRVNEVLADWVRMDETRLALEIANIGLTATPEIIAHARTLFASVLDCPGGGLRIDTIHAFSQWLLAAFPEEAGLALGTRAMEDRDRTLLAREVLSGLLLDAEAQGDEQVLRALEMLSIRMGPDEVEAYLLRCTRAGDAWDAPGPWAQGDLSRPVKRLLGLDEDASEADLLALCGDDIFNVASLRRCMEVNAAWKAATGQNAANAIGDWLAADAERRLAGFDALWEVFHTKGGELRKSGSQEKIDPDYPDYVARVALSLVAVRQMRALLDLAKFITPALTLGRAFHRRWQEAKAREGLIDFDDQIREAARLLGTQGLGEWIRYKLDRRFDHVLVDEAQDTNAAQWDIIFALTEEFFVGEGQRGDAIRTLFVVGDYKQAIFRFQGTSPENFALAAEKVKEKMAGAAANADALRDRRNVRELQELGLGQSFRTAKPILEFVDRAIAGLGHEALGLDKKPEAHVGQEREGLVTLWAPVTGQKDDEAEEGDDEAGWNSAEDDPADAPEKGDETWLARHDRALADNIARQVAAWLDPKGPGFPLRKGTHRLAGPGDIMVLVRKRAELAGLIVARLHAAGVEVAGVDRLRLGAPLAVKDLVAALRFAVQPFDDLTLAALLVSPLIGWSQQDLLDHGYRPERVPLWSHLRSSRDPRVAEAVSQLLELLARADYEPPQALLHWLLVGPWRGREKLVARLGVEANDPIDELLNAAHAYAMSDTPSIVAFLHWFDAGEGELKRETEGGGKFVRVMTVHGSKGLQAPIVILADATGDPTKSRAQGMDLADPRGEQWGQAARAPKLPLPYIGKDDRVGRLKAAYEEVQAAELEEHWRLLYVAMTRAEEALFIGGSLKPRAKMPEQSWYACLEAVFEGEPLADPLWGSRREWGSLPAYPPRLAEVIEAPARPALPDWVSRPLAAEPRPPRPLAPSSLGEEQGADPPYAPGAGSDAARRGTLIHKLLERLPEVPAERREGAAALWLERSAADLAPDLRAEMAASALAVLARAEWADLFSPASLAEVPIAALVGDQVVAGTIDRLLVTADAVRLVDFKTARRPPADLAEVPVGILRQMSAYAAALEVTFPGRRIEVALLYTQAPRLIAIPAEVLAAHKPRLSTTE